MVAGTLAAILTAELQCSTLSTADTRTSKRIEIDTPLNRIQFGSRL